MRFVVAVIIGLISAVTSFKSFAEDGSCQTIRTSGASFLERCGDKLNSFSLQLSDLKREQVSDLHGHVLFECPIPLMCEGEPQIGGWFVSSVAWQNSAKDEKSIYETLHSSPMMGISWSSPARESKPMPLTTCPLFDVSVGGMAGRAICFSDAQANINEIVAIVADDHIGFLLNFYEQNTSADMLRNKVDKLLPEFKTERATGDAGLMRWVK